MTAQSLTGLTTKHAQKLLSQYGKNLLEKSSKTSYVRLFISQYTNSITVIFVLAAALSFLIKEPVDSAFILFVLFLNGVFSFLQEFRAEKALQKLKDLIVPTVQVLRDGRVQKINAAHLVPGDIAALLEGDRIPADGILFSKVHLEVDESIFTGESLPVEKHSSDTLLSGTYIMRGRGYMRIEKTGYATKLGEIASEMKNIKPPITPLARNLDRFGKYTALIAVLLSLILFPIGFFQHREIHHLILTAISIGVAVIPEGLPLVVTVALAVGGYRMAKKRAVVRKMAAIETLGSTTVVLSDKTGTLTQNTMSVKTAWVPNEKNEQLLLRCSVLGNTARLVLKEDSGSIETMGDKTDAAFLLYAHTRSVNLDEFQKEGTLLEEISFDPETKRIEVIWQHHNKKYRFVRGAPESVSSLLPESQRKAIEKKMLEYAQEGLRVIAFAYKSQDKKEYEFLGLLALYDPPRIEAAQTLAKAKKAGIYVVMVTGDNPQTALKIGEEIGLLEEGDLVLTSEDIARLTDEELKQHLVKVRIFARMQPHDKLRLVKLYKETGAVVAVTGDGVNDSLALAEAHIGVAMGQTGTDVAKEAADVVITDDNLDTVIQAIEEGRGIFDNIVKAVVFLLSSNAVEFLVIFLGILLGLPVPLLPIQILYVNLISDGLPALALATDTKRKNLLEKKPRSMTEQIVNKDRAYFIAKISIPFALLLIGVYFLALQFLPVMWAQLIIFNLLVIGEMAIVFVVRGGILPINKFLLLTVYTSLLLQLLIMLNPTLRSFFT